MLSRREFLRIAGFGAAVLVLPWKFETPWIGLDREGRSLVRRAQSGVKATPPLYEPPPPPMAQAPGAKGQDPAFFPGLDERLSPKGYGIPSSSWPEDFQGSENIFG